MLYFIESKHKSMNTKLIIILLAALVNPSVFFAQDKNVMLFGKIENSQGDTVFL